MTVKRIVVLGLCTIAGVAIFGILHVEGNLQSSYEITEVVLLAILSLFIGSVINPSVQRWLVMFSHWIIERRSPVPKETRVFVAEQGQPSLLKEGMTTLSELEPSGRELWVVASGKGGVGKSLLALGLAEYLSMAQATLLMDFDLHNRGLTSLLDRTSTTGAETAFSLLDDFLKSVPRLALDGIVIQTTLPEGEAI